MSDVSCDTVSPVKSNLELWNKVCATDPKMSKDVKFGGREFTAVDPQWQLMEATRLWGPYGSAWGLKEIKTTFVNVGGMDKTGKSYTDPVVLLEAVFHYPGGEFQIINDMKFRAGDDTLKKLFTNTRSKALSQLGFSADVFMGKFDDDAYVKQVGLRFEERSKVAERILKTVRSATTFAKINECRNRLIDMVGDETITNEEFLEYMEEASEAEAALNKKGKPGPGE